MDELRLGVITEDDVQQGALQHLVKASGYACSATINVDDALQTPLPDIDLWVIRVSSDSPRTDELIDYFDSINKPVLYDDAEYYRGQSHKESCKRFAHKVDTCFSLNTYQESQQEKAQEVWVLGASTGGLEAVMAFLKQIPASLDHIAFVYAQHIDERMLASLIEITGRNTHRTVHHCEQSLRIDQAGVYIINPQRQIEIDEGGTIHPTNHPWSGPYTPSIDQVVAKIARIYGHNSGAIIFSGMGDDGASTCRLMSAAGGQVWVQEPTTCAVDSMPVEAMARDAVSFIGTPEELAQEFTKRFAVAPTTRG